MRSRFALLLAIAAACVTAAWAGFAPEEQITTSKASKDLRMFNGRKIVIASNGVRHCVWNDGSSIYYNRYYPGSGWTSDYKVSGSTRSCRMPAIALDPNGTDIHVVWDNGDDIYYQKCVPGTSGNGGWVGSPVNISHADKTTTFVTPSIACYKDANNVHHIAVAWCVWTGPRAVGFCECVNGTWGQPKYIAGPPASAVLWYPSIAADPLARYGEVFLATHTDRVYVNRRVNGLWQAWEDATGPGVGFGYIDADPVTGCPNIVCYDYSKAIYHTCWDPNDGWLPLEMISSPDAVSCGPPGMCFSNGSVFVVWSESTSSASGVRYCIGQHGGWSSDWLTHRYYHGDFRYVSAGASATGDVYAVYKGNVANRLVQLFGRLYTPGSGGGMGRSVVPSQLGIELFPNPAKSGRVTVQYALPHAGPMTVTLLDVSGREVRRSAFDVRSSRKGTVTIDVSGLNAGVYVARLVTGDLTVSKSLVVQH